MNDLKVLWIAPYPLETARSTDKTPSHSAPWITALADRIKIHTELTVISFSRKIKTNQYFTNNDINFLFIKLNHPIIQLITLSFEVIYKIRKELKKLGNEQFDIIHMHGTEHQYAYALRKLDIKKVISIQGLLHKTVEYLSGFNFLNVLWNINKYYERNEIKTNKNFICRTHWDTACIRNLHSDAKIFSVWEILRSEFFCDAFNANSKKIIFIGGLNALKGINEVLFSFNLINQKDSTFRLIICGNGNIDNLKRILKKLNLFHLRKNIFFEGIKRGPQLVELYKDSFCMLHPSYIDNSPNSVCEAQVCGLPVIASNVGGVSSLIKDSETGFLVERYDYKMIAAIVLELDNNKDLYLNVSKCSRKIARKRHNTENIVKKTLQVYNEIANEK